MMPNPERAANRLLDELDIRDAADLQLLREIAFAKRIVIKESFMTGAEARLLYIPGHISIITVNENTQTVQRKRFSIAHELGHFEMHRNALLTISCEAQKIKWRANYEDDPEHQANAFAAAFLLPERMVQPLIETQQPGISLASELANEYQVSLTASLMRLLKYSPHALCLVHSTNGRINWFSRSSEFEKEGYFVRRDEGIAQGSIAGRYLRGATHIDDWSTVPAYHWLNNRNLAPDAEILEWSLHSNRYGILSLLWVADDIWGA